MAGFIGSKGWKNFMAKLYGLGAAVVIVGAMFKIQHWPGAGAMLVCGLSVEAIIFFFSAFEPPHEEVDWSLVYPELAGMHGEEGHGHALTENLIEEEKEEKDSLTAQLDNMLEEAKIEPELIASLGNNLRNLGDQAAKLTDISDASAASNEFANTMKNAASSVGSLTGSYDKAKDKIEELADTYAEAKNTIESSTSRLSQSYSKATGAIEALANANEDSQNSFTSELQKVAKNLSALNASYELQLQSSNSHIKATSHFQEGLEDLLKNLNDSVDDTRKYKDQIAQLSTNLEALNTVYGNMLNAMRK
ncbi:MAG: gliding motility protein GldL [Bacteroidia bacterium]|jgi:gliding motility-associated protein GldL